MLKTIIQNSVNEALKSGDSFLVGTLRMLLAAITTKEKEKKFKDKIEGDVQLSDDDVIDVISSEVKKRKDAIVLYEKGGRLELADKERKEIEILRRYLPEQISEDELRIMVSESIERVGAKEIKDTGKIMADLMVKIKGRADGSEVSKIIKELLSK